MRILTPSEKKELQRTILPFVDDLHRVARSLCRSSVGAEELVAETIARACQSFHQLRDRSRAKPWLMKTLTNLCINEYHARARHGTVALAQTDERSPRFSLFEQLESALRSEENPEQDVIARFMDEDLQKALAAIPEDFRVVIVLCDVEGYSYEEIARIIKVPTGTVRSRFARGRVLLQKRLWYYARDLGIVPKRKQLSRKVDKNEAKIACTCGKD